MFDELHEMLTLQTFMRALVMSQTVTKADSNIRLFTCWFSSVTFSPEQ